MRAPRARRLSLALAAIGAVLLVVAEIGLYAHATIFDSKDFADRATSTLDDEAVRAEVGALVTVQLIRRAPDLLAVRPLVDATVQAAVRTDAFRSLLRDGAETAHGKLFGRESDTTTMKVVDAGALVTTALERLDPAAARRIPGGLDVKLVRLSNSADGAVATDLGQVAEDTHFWAQVAAVLALIALLASVVLAPDRRRGLAHAGLAVAAAGVVVVVLYYVGRAYVVGQANGSQAADALRVVWGTFFIDLRDWNLYLVVGGLAVAGATRAVLPELRAREAFARAGRALTTTPASTRLAVLRAMVLIVLGAAVLADREAVLALLTFLLGAGLVYAGVAEVTRIALPPVPEPGPSPAEEKPKRDRQVPLRAAAVVAGVAGLLALGGVGLALASGDDEPPFEIRECNGSEDLCDRTIAEVVFPSTHNSMGAATEPGWLFPTQNDGASAQLEAGVRGLLIDSHYGVKTPRGVYTLLERDTKSREKLEAGVGPDGVAIVNRLRRQIGYKGGGEAEIYFCHAFCELGATKGTKLLGEVRDFLASHPYEVLMISIEDGVTPKDTAELFAGTGLLDYVYQGSLDPMPTMRDLIESGERMIVMGEEHVGKVPWYRQQFDYVSETPFLFTTPAALEAPSSCEPNRGDPSNPLLLVNHWVDTSPAPRVSNARMVNARRVLLGRARRCARERRRVPGILAVDLYREGDLFEVARALNRAQTR